MSDHSDSTEARVSREKIISAREMSAFLLTVVSVLRQALEAEQCLQVERDIWDKYRMNRLPEGTVNVEAGLILEIFGSVRDLQSDLEGLQTGDAPPELFEDQ